MARVYAELDGIEVVFGDLFEKILPKPVVDMKPGSGCKFYGVISTDVGSPLPLWSVPYSICSYQMKRRVVQRGPYSG